MTKKKTISAPPPAKSVHGMVENIVGCKWSLTVIDQVRSGVRRPGAIEHSVPGLSQKVLNERLRKLVRYGILAKASFPEVPPRVEYSLTDFGERFAGVLDAIRRLEQERTHGKSGRSS
jgi:DNA-binding HxlR family transcriptional regulator